MARIDSVEYAARNGGWETTSPGPMFGGMEQGVYYGTPNSGTVDYGWDYDDPNYVSSYNGRLEQPDSFKSTVNTAKDRLTTISIGIDYSRYFTTEIKGFNFTASATEYGTRHVARVERYGYVLKNNYQEGSIWWWASGSVQGHHQSSFNPYGITIDNDLNEEALSLLSSGFSFRGIRLLLSTAGTGSTSIDSRVKVGNFRFKYKHQEPTGNLIVPAYRPSSERKRSDMIYYPGS
jgi:hypothetical protein